jgi:hypothetical protein
MFSQQVHDMLLPRIGLNSEAAVSSDEDETLQSQVVDAVKRPVSQNDATSKKPHLERPPANNTLNRFPAFMWMINDNLIVCKHVLRSICLSMQRRYNRVPNYLQMLKLASFAYSDNILTPRHFGCVTVIVNDAETRHLCRQCVFV